VAHPPQTAANTNTTVRMNAPAQSKKAII
jgi:hypothetical protein